MTPDTPRNLLWGMPRRRVVWIVVLGVIAALGLALAFVDVIIAKPLRAWGEKTMNSQLKGYTVKLERWDTHLWRFAMELKGLTIVQNAHPAVPVADIEALEFSISWRELLRLRILGDLTIQRPQLRIDLVQLQEEAKSDVKLEDRGWQGAIQSIYPLKLQQVRIHDGSLLYASADPEALPLRLTKLEFSARDLRNVRSKEGTLPSPVYVEALLFESGTLRFEGAADFLAKPNAAVKGDFRIARVPLDRLGTLAMVVQLRMKGGVLSAHGSFESTPLMQKVHLRDVLLDGWKADYVTSEATKAAETKHVEAVAKAAEKVDNAPKLLLLVDRFRITRSEVGFVNVTSTPDYRLFLSGLNLEMDNLSNQSTQGVGTFKATGDFMGSGRTMIRGGYRPDSGGADFDIDVEMRDAELASLNDLLQASAGFDVDRGTFSLFTEIAVKDRMITGYVKPMIKDLHVFGNAKDHDKGFLRQGWERIVDGIANLLENDERKEVATVIRLSGKVSDPQSNNFRVALGLLRNGFIEALLPGFLKAEEPATPVVKSRLPDTRPPTRDERESPSK